MGAADAAADERPVHRVSDQRVLHRPVPRRPRTNTRVSSGATGHPAPIAAWPAPDRQPVDAMPCSRSSPLPTSGTARIRQRATAATRSCSSASTMRWRTAGGCRRRPSGSSGCRPKRNGKRRRVAESEGAVIRGATTSISSRLQFSRGSVGQASARHAADRHLSAQRVRLVRHRRQRVGMGVRLVRREYYGGGEMKDPRGPDSGSLRIVRGGSWVNDDVTMLRCAYRHKVPPDTYAYSIGFRVVCLP